MKRILILLILAATMFTGCKNNLNNLTTNSDDVYFDPKRDKEAKKPIVEEKIAAVAPVQKQEETNPYYKDPEYNQDDYYDNAYASRIRRFDNPMYGVGYYDSYYTNSYFYNQNPYQYGVSIYNGYNFWGPSYYNYNYVPNYNWNGNYGYGTSMGYGYGNGYGYSNYGNSYNPYGYYGYSSPYCNNNYWGNSYGNNWGNQAYGNPYMTGYGYGNGYNNGYYNGYANGYNSGYSNSYDHNSVYYGPRTAHTGGNGNGSGPDFGPKSVIHKSNITEQIGPNDPTNIDRFNYIPIKSNASNGGMTKGENNPTFTPHTTNNLDDTYSNPRTTNGGVKNNGGMLNNTTTPVVKDDEPVRGKNWDWNSSGNNNTGNNSGNNNSGNQNNTNPRNDNWNTPRPDNKPDPIQKNNGGTVDTPSNSNRGGSIRKK